MIFYLTHFLFRVDLVLLAVVVLLTVIIIIRAQVKERTEELRRREIEDIEKTYSSGGSTPEIILPRLLDLFSGLSRKTMESAARVSFDANKSDEVIRIARYGRNKWLRIKAIMLLGFFPSADKEDILRKALEDKDNDVSYFAMTALGRNKTPATAQILLDFLERKRFGGQKIVSILEHFPADIIELVMKKTSHPDPQVRFWAVKLASRFPSAEYLNSFISLAQDSSAGVRAAACQCLGRIGRPEAKSVLLSCLSDRAWFVRLNAITALTDIFAPDRMEEIIGRIVLLMADTVFLVREKASSAAAADIKIALPYLEQGMKDADPQTARECISAIVDSGYVSVLLNDILSDYEETQKRARHLLQLMVSSGVFFGLKKNLPTFPPDKYDRLMKIIAGMDPALTERLRQ